MHHIKTLRSTTGRPHTTVVPSHYNGAANPHPLATRPCQGNNVSLAMLEHRPPAGPLRSGADTVADGPSPGANEPLGHRSRGHYTVLSVAVPSVLFLGEVPETRQPCCTGSSLRPLASAPSVDRTIALVLGSRAPVWCGHTPCRCAAQGCSRRPTCDVRMTKSPDQALLSLCRYYVAHDYMMGTGQGVVRPRPCTHNKESVLTFKEMDHLLAKLHT